MQPMQVCLTKSFQSPSALMISDQLLRPSLLRVCLLSLELPELHVKFPKSRWHGSHGMATEHCFNALFWTSVSTQADNKEKI